MQDRVNLTSMHEILNEKETSEITADLNSNYGSQNQVKHLLVWRKTILPIQNLSKQKYCSNEVKIK